MRQDKHATGSSAAHSSVHQSPEAMINEQGRTSHAMNMSEENGYADSINALSAPPSKLVSLARLSAVEIQLVAQYLNSLDKIRAARTCHHMLSVIKHPFAWAGCGSEGSSDELVITFERFKDVPSLVSVCRNNALLHHAPLHFRLELQLFFAGVPNASMFSLLFSLPNATGFDVAECMAQWQLKKPLIEAFKESSSVREKLRILKLGIFHHALFDAELTELILRLPHLEHLAIAHVDLVGIDLASLPPLNLISLETMDSESRETTVLNRLAEYTPKLRSVILRQNGYDLPLERWREATLSNITELTIIQALLHGSIEQHNASMSNLHSLERLALRDVWKIDQLLPSLSHCPRLQHLAIQLRGCFDRPHQPDPTAVKYLPSVSVISSLLNQCPSMHLVLEVSSSTTAEWMRRMMELEQSSMNDRRITRSIYINKRTYETEEEVNGKLHQLERDVRARNR